MINLSRNFTSLITLSGTMRKLRSTDRGGSRESCHEVTDEVKNLLNQPPICRDDYIRPDIKLQSGAGVPPTLFHCSLLLLTFQKSRPKSEKSEK